LVEVAQVVIKHMMIKLVRLVRFFLRGGG